MFGLAVIVFTTALSLAAYMVAPDNSPSGNEQLLQLESQPPGFTIQTEACREYMRSNGVSAEVDRQMDAALKKLEELQGQTLGKGICNYSAQELRQVIGMKSAAVRDVLPRASEEAVHRDYLVVD